MDELLDILSGLGEEELKVLVVLARRLAKGQTDYAVLNLRQDTRDMLRERAEELADALIYGAMEEVKRHLT